MSDLELVRLQFALSRFGGERRHIGADGSQSFDVGVKHDGRDEAAGCAHRYTQVHHMIPGKNWNKSILMTAQKFGQRDFCFQTEKRWKNVCALSALCWHNSAATPLETNIQRSEWMQ